MGVSSTFSQLNPIFNVGDESFLLEGISLLCQFPVASVTNRHKLSGLNNTHLFSYTSGGQKSDSSVTGLKSRGDRAVSLLQATHIP